MEFRLETKATLARDAAAAKRAVTTVNSVKELDELPFWMQGDDKLNTDSAFLARAQLRMHPEVAVELQHWWETVQRSMRQTHGAAYAASAVTREEYIKVSRLLSKSMMEEFDPAEAQRAAEEDFEADAAGGDTLTREQFMDAIFECGRARASAARLPHWLPPTAPGACRHPRTCAQPHSACARVCASRLCDLWTKTVNPAECARAPVSPNAK
jgi:hypothetical protein